VATKFRGIADGRKEPLCRTCSHAQYVQGESLVNLELICHFSDWGQKVMHFEATTCTKYDDKRIPSRYDLEKIAWQINSDAKAGKIGFVNPREWKKITGDNDY
jgi:hypothetical protein